jgi:hypothetical protein
MEMMMLRLKLLTLSIAVVLISGCAGRSVENRIYIASSVASTVGFKAIVIPTRPFKLATYQRLQRKNHVITLYIEGDGMAWINRNTISRNPTPRDPLALRLAAQDKTDNVVYMGRPCQYVNLKLERSCNNANWTSHRFSKTVIDAYDQALTQLASSIHGKGFHLVGYSGGGAIAALLAAKRSDVLSLRTIAGNLNHDALNKARRVSPLSGSLDAINVTHQLKNVPQIHYSGGDDDVVPAWVAQSFVQKVGNSSCVKRKIIENVTHSDGWVQFWRTHYLNQPKC